MRSSTASRLAFLVLARSSLGRHSSSAAAAFSTSMSSRVTTRSTARRMLSNSKSIDAEAGSARSSRKAAAVTPSPKKRKRAAKSPTPASESTEHSDEFQSAIEAAATAAASNGEFIDLRIPPQELRPSATLTTGQCFHWKALEKSAESKSESSPTAVGSLSSPPSTSAWGTHDATEWIGTVRVDEENSVVVIIKETKTSTLYRALTPIPSHIDMDDFFRSYFQLDVSLAELYDEWSQADERLRRIAQCIPGVRIINQDPWECLVSFICSSNNNIPRITKMLAAIRREFGKPLWSVRGGNDDENGNGGGDSSSNATTAATATLYAFPSLQDMLHHATDEKLRSLCGLGYRSKYIMETIRILDELGGEEYLHELRKIQDPVVVQEKLCQFCGVGRKVADCVALFSLQQDAAIPVDVHVWNIARRDYDPDDELGDIKSITPKVYKQVGDLFRSQFPTKAGWAHSLLFVAELPSFRPALPADIVNEMDQFRQEEQERKKVAAAAKTKKK